MPPKRRAVKPKRPDLPSELRQLILKELARQARNTEYPHNHDIFYDPCMVVQRWARGGGIGGPKASYREDTALNNAVFWKELITLVFDPVYMRQPPSDTWGSTHLPRPMANDNQPWTWKRIFSALCKASMANTSADNFQIVGEKDKPSSAEPPRMIAGFHGIGPGIDIDAWCIRIACMDYNKWTTSGLYQLTKGAQGDADLKRDYADASVHDMLSVLQFFGADLHAVLSYKLAKSMVHIELEHGYDESGMDYRQDVISAASYNKYVHVVDLVLSSPITLISAVHSMCMWQVVNIPQGIITTRAAERIQLIVSIFMLKSPGLISLNRTRLNGYCDAFARLCSFEFEKSADQLNLVRFFAEVLNYNFMSTYKPYPYWGHPIAIFDGPSTFHSILRVGIPTADGGRVVATESLLYLLDKWDEKSARTMPEKAQENGKYAYAWKWDSGLGSRRASHTLVFQHIPFNMLIIRQEGPDFYQTRVTPQYLERVIEFYDFLNEERRRLGYAYNEFINWQDDSGRVPLHLLIYQGDVDLMEPMVKHGATLDFVTELGETFLHYAADQIFLQHKDADTFIKLLELNQRYNGNKTDWLFLKDKRERTPYDLLKRHQAELQANSGKPSTLSAIDRAFRALDLIYDSDVMDQVKAGYSS